jgi:hypothetical protein
MANVSGVAGRPYSLRCYSSPLMGESFIEDFSDIALRYRHATRYLGGYWDASWFIPFSDPRLVGNSPFKQRALRQATEYLIRDWFENRLMYRIKESAGGSLTWQGLVWRMELTYDGSKTVKDIEEVFNRVKVVYTDLAGAKQETAWYDNTPSQNRYGIRELIIPMDNVSATQAQTRAQTELAQMAHPIETAVSFQQSELEDEIYREGLEVRASGDIFTANSRYVGATSADGATGNLSTFVQAIIENDCQFLSVGNIQANTVQVRRSFKTPTRAWDALLDLVEIGDSQFRPWTIYSHGGARVRYELANNAPRYEWRGRKTGLVDLIGGGSPWAVLPGVIRDTTRRSTPAVPGTFLQKSNDSWVAEIEMASGSTQPIPKPFRHDDDALLEAYRMNQRWLEEEG